MTVQLGAGFRPRFDAPAPEPMVPTDTDRILAALSNLTFALQAAQAPPPPPQIIIPEPDLGAIVTAVNGLKPGADADDVARAVVAQLAPPAPADNTQMNATLERVADSLKALDFRMQAPTSMIGGGILHMDPAQLDASGNVKVANSKQPNLVGTWGYTAGVSGTVTVAASARVVGITAHCTTAGSLTINGGASVPIPANTAVVFNPNAQLVAPTIVFTGTDSYLVETIT